MAHKPVVRKWLKDPQRTAGLVPVRRSYRMRTEDDAKEVERFLLGFRSVESIQRTGRVLVIRFKEFIVQAVEDLVVVGMKGERV